jgi:hypothetical protein
MDTWSWWAVVVAILYFVLLFTAGAATLRKGRVVLLVVGVVFPVLWLVGWLLPERQRRHAG